MSNNVPYCKSSRIQPENSSKLLSPVQCIETTTIRFFIHCTSFSNQYNFSNISGKPRPSGTLKWKVFPKKEELRVEKVKI